MLPILGRYGPFFFYTYTLVLGLGISMALLATAILARRRRLTGWQDGLVFAGLAAVLAGRIVFIGLNRAYFAENPGQAWLVWQGGLNAQGALLAGLAVYLLWARLTGRPAIDWAGLIAPGLALVVAAGWAACWFEGCAYGAQTMPGWAAAGLPDDFGVYATRYQTQPAGVILALIIFAVSFRAALTGQLVVVFWATLGALALSHGFITLFRGDPAPTVGPWRLDVIIDAVILAVAGTALLWLQIKRSGRQPASE